MIGVDLVDPSAYTPPYDHALASALARRGAHVRLVTSEFAYGSVPLASGYEVVRHFYRHASGAPGSRRRQATKLAEHIPDMLRYARAARAADVVHLQWLTVPAIDRHLLPRRPLVLTAHDLPQVRNRRRLEDQRRLCARVGAVIAHSQFGARALIDVIEVDPAKVHVIHHGAFEHLTRQPSECPLSAELAGVEGPVVLFFGLLRPYKGLEVLLDAWRGIERGELWIVGRPRMDISALQARGERGVRWLPRFVSDEELPAFFRRADIVVLPYTATERVDQSGVLATALAFGRVTVLSDIGGFPDVAATGAATLVPPGDADALRRALAGLIDDDDERGRLAAAALAAGRNEFSWDGAAERTLALYEALCGRIPPA